MKANLCILSFLVPTGFSNPVRPLSDPLMEPSNVTVDSEPSGNKTIQHNAHNETIDSSSASYAQFTRRSFNVLQGYYDTSSGLWNGGGWWNAANSLTVIAKYAFVQPSVAAQARQILQTTYQEASGHALQSIKAIKDGAPIAIGMNSSAAQVTNFIGEYYDDEGWWALGWIFAYDLTRNMDYLETAAKIFQDMVNGRTGPCGGVWWNRNHDAEVSITNELFTELAASLGNHANMLPGKAIRGGGTSSWYRQWAVYSWQWFKQSGLINAQNLINDGLDLQTCKNNNATTWTYNQGVILGALAELYQLTGDKTLLDQAMKIALAAIHHLTDRNGILHEPCEPDCSNDGSQFKGIFVRGMVRLHAARPNQVLEAFLRKNAASIYHHDQNLKGHLGLNWAGPFLDPATPVTQTSAMDALVAVLQLNKNPGTWNWNELYSARWREPEASPVL